MAQRKYPDTRYLTGWEHEDHVARMVGRTVRTLEAWRQAGKIHGRKHHAGAWFYRPSDAIWVARAEDYSYESSRGVLPGREEAFDWLIAEARAGRPVPRPQEIAARFGVSAPCARNWRVAWLRRVVSRWHLTDDELAGLTNSTINEIRAARPEARKDNQ